MRELIYTQLKCQQYIHHLPITIIIITIASLQSVLAGSYPFPYAQNISTCIYIYHFVLIWLGPLPHLISHHMDVNANAEHRFTFFKKIHDDERVSGTPSKNTHTHTNVYYIHTEDTKGYRFACNCYMNLFLFALMLSYRSQASKRSAHTKYEKSA